MIKNTIPILYDYKKYANPRKGIFLVHKNNGKYSLSDGWENELKEYTIIGEDNDSFVYKLKKSKQGKWVDGEVIIEKFILPIGLHKSRLVNWVDGQLSLF
jgi:hypothetical protein